MSPLRITPAAEPTTDVDFDLLDFDARDEAEAADAVAARSVLYDLPARPGTRR